MKISILEPRRDDKFRPPKFRSLKFNVNFDKSLPRVEEGSIKLQTIRKVPIKVCCVFFNYT